jgi:hypothetical protein
LVCVREELWALQSAKLLGGIIWTWFEQCDWRRLPWNIYDDDVCHFLHRAASLLKILTDLSVSAFLITSGCKFIVLRNHPIAGHGVSWVAMFIYELFIFVLTVFKTCKIRALPRFSLISRRDILDIIFHDGISFVASVMWTLNHRVQVWCTSRESANGTVIRVNLI